MLLNCSRFPVVCPAMELAIMHTINGSMLISLPQAAKVAAEKARSARKIPKPKGRIKAPFKWDRYTRTLPKMEKRTKGIHNTNSNKIPVINPTKAIPPNCDLVNVCGKKKKKVVQQNHYHSVTVHTVERVWTRNETLTTEPRTINHRIE